ncbi:MAG: iron-siderophore ABC transporter substrate-binding protein [Elainella sp. C42_A2020_010]|nr:iron-siderophore ABC transporter substrate-binding protein [Elainella sp. C42_A2020_010]RNJ67578.1 MAG: iron-siderophore ABC transporter substrate-binding protein [Leptolyngbya sp. IPPAS B-1204]
MSCLVSYRIKPFLLLAFLCLLVTNCASPAIEKNVTSIQQPDTTSECRMIQHQFGETCVPLKPQRIVALDSNASLDSLVALGIKPVGFASFGYADGEEVVHGVPLDKLAGAKSVGYIEQPSLEKVLLLKPDLIFATDYHPYQLLSAIAPTIPIPYPNFDASADKAFFEENLHYIAKVVDKETEAEEILDQYHKRIEDLKKRLGNQLERIEVSVIYYTLGLIYTPTKNYDAATDVLIDTGIHLKRPTGHISIETIEEYNTDILFVINVERKPLSFYSQHPVFSHLKAVKNNRVYLVPPERWDTRGILGANQILDDLFKYLLDDG